MALQSCYECNKEISTKAIMCPQCGAPQNPVSGLMDKAKEKIGKTFKKVKEEIKEIQEERDFNKEGGELEKMLEEMSPFSGRIRRMKEEKESKTILSKFRPKE